MVLVKKALQAVSYIYASSILTTGPNTMTLLPNTYSTELQCRTACSNNIACVQFSFWTFNNIPGCYTSTTTSTLTTTGLSSTEPGYIIAIKIPLITITNFDSIAIGSVAGINWNNFYTCNSIFTPGGTESSTTCGTTLPSGVKSRAVDGSFCKYSSNAGVPSAFSCDATFNVASCYSGQGYSSFYKTCSLCSGNYFSAGGGLSKCGSCPDNGICLSGHVVACFKKPYGFYVATDTSVATCIACPNQWGFNWQSTTKTCACAYPNTCSGAGASVGFSSCQPGYGFTATATGGNQCSDCLKYVGSGTTVISAFSLGTLPCAPCGGSDGGGICASRTSPTLKNCYPGYGFYPTDGVSPSSCTVCSSISPGTFSLGSLPCSSCGLGAILAGAANTASASCTACGDALWSSGGVTTSCSPCAVGTAVCDAGTSIVSQCLAKYGYSSTASTTCTACTAATNTYSLGGISKCVPCYPTGAGCYTDTGMVKTCPAGSYYSPGTNGIASCVACTGGTTYSLGFVNNVNALSCSPCSGGIATCDPTTGNPITCQAKYGISATACTSCNAQYYSKGGSSVCLNCLPLGAYCVPDTGVPTTCPAGFYYSSGSSTNGIANCVPCNSDDTTYSLGFVNNVNAYSCIPCPTGISQCDPTNGNPYSCTAGYGATMKYRGGNTIANCVDCGLSNQWSSGGATNQCIPCKGIFSTCTRTGDFTGCLKDSNGNIGPYGTYGTSCVQCLSNYPARLPYLTCGCPTYGSCYIAGSSQNIQSCNPGYAFTATDCKACLGLTWTDSTFNSPCQPCDNNGGVNACSHVDGTATSCKPTYTLVGGECIGIARKKFVN